MEQWAVVQEQGKHEQEATAMDIEKMFQIGPEDYPKPEPMTREEIINQYQRTFAVINRKLFNNELPPIEIDYPADDHRKKGKCLACFSFDTDRITPPVIFLQFEAPPEWGVSIDDINDLFHELIHYYCYLHNIRDCDWKEINGTIDISYHNLQFKKVAEAHAATCNYSNEESGYNDTNLPDKILWEIFDEL